MQPVVPTGFAAGAVLCSPLHPLRGSGADEPHNLSVNLFRHAGQGAHSETQLLLQGLSTSLDFVGLALRLAKGLTTGISHMSISEAYTQLDGAATIRSRSQDKYHGGGLEDLQFGQD